MIDAFSMRAKQIVFAARFKAGEHGANLIDVEDFLLGLVLEDQRMLGENLFSKLQDGSGGVQPAKAAASAFINCFQHRDRCECLINAYRAVP